MDSSESSSSSQADPVENVDVSQQLELTEEQLRHTVEIVGRAELADGVDPLDEQVQRTMSDTFSSAAEGQHFLAVLSRSMSPRGDESSSGSAVENSIAGYAQLRHSVDGSSAELVVDPQHRRKGAGRALAQAVLQLAPEVALWAHGNLAAAQSLSHSLGLHPTRSLLRMRREVTASLSDPLPRSNPAAQRGDEAAVEVLSYAQARTRWSAAWLDSELIRVNNAAFSWHPEQGGWDQAELDRRRQASWFDADGLLMAFDSTPGLVAFHWTKMHPSPTQTPETGSVGEVYVVGVDPQAQGRGLGALMTTEGLRYLESQGARSEILYVEADNGAALKTYSRLGFMEDERHVTYQRHAAQT